MSPKTLIVCTFLALLVLNSCATILNGRYQNVDIITNVPGAEVYLNDQLADTTPCTIAVPRTYKKDQQVRVSKKGYSTESFVLQKKLNENTLLGIPYLLIPVGVDALTGSIIRYQKPDTILLVPKKKTR
jgi:hypothetical protein